jgi:hypothetical protein
METRVGRIWSAGARASGMGWIVRGLCPLGRAGPGRYDVGVAFDEPYVSRMFLTAQAGLSVAVVDANGSDRPAGAPNLWGRGPDLKLGEQETEFIKTLHYGTQLCAPVDMATLVHDEGVTAGAGELLAPSAQHVAELRAAGRGRPA